MTDVALHIDDPAVRITIKAMLEAAGHRVVTHNPDVIIADAPDAAVELAKHAPTLTLAAAADLPRAIDAMRNGVFGYIFLPLQPGEAVLMVDRAVNAPQTRHSRGSGNPANAPSDTMPDPTEDLTLATLERDHVLRVLRAHKSNHTAAARALGIGRNTLWRKLKQYQREV